MDKQTKITDKLIIKHSNWEKKDIQTIIGIVAIIGIFLIDYYYIKSLVLFLILVFPFSYLLSKMWYKSADTDEKIVIDKNGITIPEKSQLIPWLDIQYAYIQQHSSGVGKHSRVTDYFHICTRTGEILINMTKLKYDPETIKEAVEYYSGRNIGDFNDQVFEKVLKIIGDEKEVQDINLKMSNHFKNQFIWAPIILLVPFGIAIVLQIIISFPYIIAIWWATLVFGLCIYQIYYDKTLKKRLELNKLSDENFSTIKEEYGAQYELNYSKKKVFFMYAFLVLSVFVVFWFSYFASSK